MFTIIDSGDGPQRTGPDRACDHCKERKVRCNMIQPCRTCSRKGLSCTYNRPRKKRGPPAKHVSEARQSQSRSPVQFDSALSDGASIPKGPAVQSVSPAAVIQEQCAVSLHASTTPEPLPPLQDVPYSPTTFPPGTESANSLRVSPGPGRGGLTLPTLPIGPPSNSPDTFSAIPMREEPVLTIAADYWPPSVREEALLPWIDIYFQRIHPTIPILNRANLYRDMLHRKHHCDPQHGAMLLALCAFAMTQLVQTQERAFISHQLTNPRPLLDECVRMRVTAEFGENPSIESILASFFLFACCFGSSQHKAARHRLREAVDLAYSLGLQRPEAYEGLDPETREQWLRTYLVLSVTERAYALQQRHSIDFRGRPSITARFMQTFVPVVAMEPPSYRVYRDQSGDLGMTGLLYLMETFDGIDENVVECWNGHCRYSDGACDTFDKRRALDMFRAQHRVREASLTGSMAFGCYSSSSSSSPSPGTPALHLSQLPESQQVDISVTHFWLLNRLWNLCWSHGLLRESSDHRELRYDFALEIAGALWVVCSQADALSMEVHGVGLVEKIYDVAMGVLLAMTLSASMELDATPAPLSCDVFPVTDRIGSVLTIRDLLHGFEKYLQRLRGGDHPYAAQFASTLRQTEGGMEAVEIPGTSLLAAGADIGVSYISGSNI